MGEEDEKLKEELPSERCIRDLSQERVNDVRDNFNIGILTSSSSRSGFVRNFEKKYLLLPSSMVDVGVESRLRFKFPFTDLLPIMARSFTVASLITGMIVATDVLSCSNAPAVAMWDGREKGSCKDQNVL